MKGSQPRLLVLSPEPIVPPGHGGSLRSVNIIVGLARHFETTALVPQSQAEIDSGVLSNPELKTVHWVSIWNHQKLRPANLLKKLRRRLDTRREEQLRFRWKGVYRDWYFGPLSSWNYRLETVFSETSPDVVMIEHTRHSATMDMVRRLRPQALRVVDSHNVESELLRQVLPEALPMQRRQKIVQGLEDYERQLDQRCEVLWSCSSNDESRYRQLGIQRPVMGVVPNGVDTKANPCRESQPLSDIPRILFTGTLCYEPNENGIFWFYREVWPRLTELVPKIRWQIVGRAPSQAIVDLAKNDDSIDLAANVASVQPYLEQAHVSICPLLSGSGTRLKILEAFSAGLPMVSTRLGAEGIEAVPDRDILIEDNPAEFACAIARLINIPAESERIRKSARRLVVEKYDWSILTDKAASQLISELDRQKAASRD